MIFKRFFQALLRSFKVLFLTLKRLFLRQNNRKKTGSGDAGALYQRALDHFGKEKWDQAINLLLEAELLDPNSPAIPFTLGITYTKRAASLQNESCQAEQVDLTMNAFERALEKFAHSQSDLSKDNLHTICLNCGGYYRDQKQDFNKARHFAQQGLAYFPKDPDFLMMLAINADKASEAEEAEQWTERLLELYPYFKEARRLRKKSRKAQGKDFWIDLSENKKREIYKDYAETKNNRFLTKELETQLKRANGINEYTDITSKAGQSAYNSAISEIVSKYNLRFFEISLINEEGDTKNWDIGYANINKAPQAPSRVDFRDRLKCAYCDRPQKASYWPPEGDHIAFYWETAEEVQESPGEYHLPILCPFCEKIWYVLWNDDPGDPIGNLILRHIQRMREEIEGRDVTFLADFISDDLLGNCVNIVKEMTQSAIEEHQIKDRFFVQDNYFVCVTICPEADFELARAMFPQGYLSYFEQIFKLAQEQGRESRRILNWVLCTNQSSRSFNCTFFPSQKEIETQGESPIFAYELLSEQDKSQLFGALKSEPTEILNLSQLTKELISGSQQVRDTAIGKVLSLRNQESLDSVEIAIKQLTGKENIEFYRPGIMLGGFAPKEAYERILQIARDGKISEDPALVQSMIPKVSFLNQNLMQELERIDSNSLAIYQLLGIQIQLSIMLNKS